MHARVSQVSNELPRIISCVDLPPLLSDAQMELGLDLAVHGEAATAMDGIVNEIADNFHTSLFGRPVFQCAGIDSAYSSTPLPADGYICALPPSLAPCPALA